MKKIKIIIFFVLPTLTLEECFNDSSANDDNPNTLFAGQPQFSFKLLHQIRISKNKKDNIFFSPLSIYSSMIQIYLISAGHTEESVRKALFLSENKDKSSIAQAYKKLKSISLSKNSDLSSSNGIFVANEFDILDCMKSFFDDDIASVKFGSEQASKLINLWVRNRTRNEILEMVQPGQPSAETSIAMVNAAYFKGSWKNIFPKKTTHKSTFHVSESQVVPVTMMFQGGDFKFGISKKLGAQVLEMPYAGDDMSMYLFLPLSKPNGLPEVLDRFSFDIFREIIENEMSEDHVNVFIPKFEVKDTSYLGRDLVRIGLSNLFSLSADLSGLTNKPELHLDEVVHQAKLTVDEVGTRASAASSVLMYLTGMTPEFRCNSPFMYLIYSKNLKAILFIGIFRTPLVE